MNLVVLAFSGGGTRAAAFSYGVLEALRRIEVVAGASSVRLLDEVDVITGVSGGSFTALAYGLYGDKLFDEYEPRFLKRDVQGELIERALNPLNWGASARAAGAAPSSRRDLYDEILFHGATFADLERADGPLIAVGAPTSRPARASFHAGEFDVICADLGTVRLARAAAASSAVPVVLSPLTINNYGGTAATRSRPGSRRSRRPRPAAARGAHAEPAAGARETSMTARSDPYLHLVDGGVSDNLGLRGVLDFLETFEALHAHGRDDASRSRANGSSSSS